MSDTVEGFKGLEALYLEMGEEYDETDYEPLLREILQDLQVQHGIYFNTETSPSDVKWPGLSTSTIQRKGHDTILYDTGRLKASLESQSQDSIRVVSVGEGPEDFVVFGTSVPYSYFHQEGTRRMPQRMHVGINETIMDIFAEKAADTVADSLAGK